MSARAEYERREVERSNSPIALHSLSNRNMRSTLEGRKRVMTVPRKVRWAAIRRARRLAAIQDYEDKKYLRILGRVIVQMDDNEGIMLQPLSAEIRFVERYPHPLYV